jgi:hypothetical protein
MQQCNNFVGCPMASTNGAQQDADGAVDRDLQNPSGKSGRCVIGQQKIGVLPPCYLKRS